MDEFYNKLKDFLKENSCDNCHEKGVNGCSLPWWATLMGCPGEETNEED